MSLIGMKQLQPTDPESVRVLLENPENTGRTWPARLDQAGGNRAIQPAQAADRHALTLAPSIPRLGTRGDDLLPEDLDGVPVDGGHRANDFADHGDRIRDEPGRVGSRRDTHDMADPQVTRVSPPPVDRHGDIRPIGDARVVDDDAAETLDRSDKAGAADATVASCRAVRREPRAADADVARLLRRCNRIVQRRCRRPERSDHSPSRPCETLCHRWPASSSGPLTRSRKT
jgi:hypothetical protein